MDLIFLHSTVASGKLTTASALEVLLGYPAFHNHLVVDALTTVFPFGIEPFVRLREEFWLQLFTDAARTARSFLDPTVRAFTSGLAPTDPAAVQCGLDLLEQDLASGPGTESTDSCVRKVSSRVLCGLVLALTCERPLLSGVDGASPAPGIGDDTTTRSRQSTSGTCE